MTDSTHKLPSFENPPVTEVALGVEFAPLTGWRSAYAGLYWAAIKDEFPGTEIQPPLPSQIESLDEVFWPHPSVRLEMGNPDMNRMWFLSEPSNRLIQLQKNRFIFNWRKVSGDEAYPRYFDYVRPQFEQAWEGFLRFVADQKLGELDVQQCEVSYVNDIFQGQGWEDFQDALDLFAPWWKGGSDGFLPAPEFVNLAGAFRLPEDRGRLHFAAQGVTRQTDQKRAVQLRLTARGRPKSGSTDDMLEWMDFGHEWVVRGFSDLTSKEAHELWKRST